MTRRITFRVGVLLLALGLAYPAWLMFVESMQSRTTQVEVPLETGKPIDVPVHVAWGANFTLAIEAKTTHGADLDGPESCLLDLPEPGTAPPPCVGVADRLSLAFRVEDSSGKVVAGAYGAPMADRYPNREREYGVFLGDSKMGNELLILQTLKRGNYRLRVTDVHVPAGLTEAAPRITLDQEGSMFAFLTVLPLLALSALLALAGAIVLVIDLVSSRRRRTPA